ncbi:MAG: hypothetical protein NWQ26_07035 [Paraglaciecola sp.]|nr:hypothetical protein [Paraglaciecola sp.]
MSRLKQKWGAFRTYVFLVLGCSGLLYLGFYLGNYAYNEQQNEISSLHQSLQNLKTENEKVVKQLNILRVELDVLNLAQQKNFTEIKQGIERESVLQKDLAFYQQIMAPELTQEGFAIEAFNVEKSLSERSYRFEIVMLQREKIKSTIKGNLEVTLVGSEAGQSKQYALKEVLVNPEQQLVFSFKYFQVVDGELQLPENFQVERVTILSEIYQFNSKKGELHSTFNWVVSNISE